MYVVRRILKYLTIAIPLIVVLVYIYCKIVFSSGDILIASLKIRESPLSSAPYTYLRTPNPCLL